MPLVKWIRKDQVSTQYIAVPFRVLKHDYHYEEGVETSKETENGHTIIQGDHLETLKSILPQYKGRINLIYADLPDHICSNEWISRNQKLFVLMNQLLSDAGIICFKEQDGSVIKDPQTTISEILQNNLSSNTIILDLFTHTIATAYAILHLNKKDGGTRQFILINKKNDFPDTITTEVKRVINGYKNKAAKGGCFDHYSLGETLFTGNNLQLLNSNIPVKQIREYIWFSETGCGFYNNQFCRREPYLLGIYKHTAYYFMYENDWCTVLNSEFVAAIETKADQYIIYANNTTLSENELKKNHIRFKLIPTDIIRI